MAGRSYAPIRILALAGMEFCWICGFLLLFQYRACDQCLFLPGILCFGPLAFLISGILRSWKRGRALRHPILWFCWLVAAVLFTGSCLNDSSSLIDLRWLHTFPGRVFSIERFPSPELLTLFGTALLWFFGQRLSDQIEDDSILMSEFQFGLFMLLILLFIDSQWDFRIPGLLSLTMIFFLFALTGLAVNLLHGGSDWLSSGRRTLWLGVTLSIVCIILAAGFLAVHLLSPDLMNRVVHVLEEIWRFISYWVAKFLLYLASLFPAPEPQKLNLPPAPPGVDHDPSALAKLLRFPEWLRKLGSFFVAAIWIFLFVGALWTLSTALFRWLVKRMAQDEDAEVEYLAGALKEDLLLFLKLLAFKMGKLCERLLRLIGLGVGGRTARPASARLLYRRLLRWAAGRGFPRMPAQTPREYVGTLVERMPGAQSEISFITSHYVIERYSPTPVASALVEEMEAKWKEVKRAKIVKSEVREP